MWFDSWSDLVRVAAVGTDGQVLSETLRAQRVNLSEVRQAIRASGSGDLSTIAAVVLETDGTLSVSTRGQAGDRSALEGVAGDRT